MRTGRPAARIELSESYAQLRKAAAQARIILNREEQFRHGFLDFCGGERQCRGQQRLLGLLGSSQKDARSQHESQEIGCGFHARSRDRRHLTD
jgi:hypothetical protein